MTETQPGAVILLANERDFAADTVIRRLHELSVPVTRLNIEQARQSAVPSWSSDSLRHEAPPAADVVWWRQFETDDDPRTRAAIDDLLVERAQWRTWVSTLDTESTTWVNPVWAARRAENKVEQLRVAPQVGFRVPTTLVTNSAAEAAAFRREVGPSVVKTLSSAYYSFSDRSFVFTELLDDDVLALEGWTTVPVIVQHALLDALDARIVSFDWHCFGGRCLSKGVDWRKTPFDADLWQRWDVPDKLRRMCVDYRQRMGLQYAAFDFMIDADDVFFLEANQAGEWLFLDHALDIGISDALGDWFARLSGHGV